MSIGKCVAVDAAFNTYVVGYTSSATFPVTPNALDNSLSGPYDIFFTKFGTTGGIQFSTFFGGSGTEVAAGIGLDSAGNIVIAGATTSTNLTTLNAVQGTIGGVVDGFVTKIKSDLTGLHYSTYLGGTGTDTINGINVGAQGNVVVVGSTTSTDFTTTPGVIGLTNAGGTDAFATKILN